MGLVTEGLFALGLILMTFWLLGLRGSVTQDRAKVQMLRRQEQAAAERATSEARLHRQGEKLRCLGCEYTFTGPLPDTGCPQCHLSALVVTEHDFQQGRQALRASERSEEEK